MGATEGNIMAASITTHVVTKNPSGPGSVQRPMSIPLSWVDVKIQLTAAKISRVAIRPASRGSIRAPAGTAAAADGPGAVGRGADGGSGSEPGRRQQNRRVAARAKMRPRPLLNSLL